MTVKHIRQELDALRERLTGGAAAPPGPSAIDDIEARIDRMAVRQREDEKSSAANDLAGLARWWRERFGQEITP